MTRRILSSVAALAGLVAAGCSTTPVPKYVAPDRPAAELAQLRTKPFDVNLKRLDGAKPDGFFSKTILVAPGKRTFSAAWSHTVSMGNQSVTYEYEGEFAYPFEKGRKYLLTTVVADLVIQDESTLLCYALTGRHQGATLEHVPGKGHHFGGWQPVAGTTQPTK